MAKKYVLGASAARKFRELIGSGERVESRQSAGGAMLAVKMPAPFTVQWAASANEGEGAWIIYLPSENLVYYGGSYVDITSSLSPAGGEYPDGWYSLGDSFDESIRGVWLSPNDGRFRASSTIGSIQIAKISDKRVTQIVSSAIFGGGGSSLPRPFEFIDGVVSAGEIPCPRYPIRAESYVITKDTTNIYLHVDLSNNYYTLTINETSREQSATHAQYLLYKIESREVVLDSRPSVIPVLEIL